MAQAAKSAAEMASQKRVQPSGDSPLVARNVVVGGRRTSLRLEPSMWEALQEISLREALSVSQLCTRIDERRVASGLTAAVRVYILSYFRAAATDSGHASAGHGQLGNWQRAS
ncbi:ribbon-helix-helix domain-containing protein [Rhodovibrionaceae bacterium A322]